MKFTDLLNVISPSASIRAFLTDGNYDDAKAIEFLASIEGRVYPDFEIDCFTISSNRLNVYASAEGEN